MKNNRKVDLDIGVLPNERETGKPECILVGTDGNVFMIIGTVAKCLKRAGKDLAAQEFTARAFKAGSYDVVLQLCFEYVDVC